MEGFFLVRYIGATDAAFVEPDLLKAWDREARGIPIGRPAEVNLRNNHTQYIFTW
jgi:cytochrome oxidase assembly protein ShyY1